MNISALRVCGKDSKDFLHRLTTVNLHKLTVGKAALGLLLNSSAKVQGAFTLLCSALDDYLLVFPSEDEYQRVHAEFERLHFSEQMEFLPLPGTSGFLKDMQSETARAEFFPFERDPLSWPSFLPGRRAAFGAVDGLLLAAEQVEEERIRAGLPKWGAEYGAESNALDVGLLPWIHENKGCYPGQEVVERSLRIGHPARALVRLQGEHPIAVGEEILLDGKALGKITSAIGVYALGIVPWKHRELSEFARIGGVFRCQK